MFKGNFHIKDCFVLVFDCTCFRIFKGNFHLIGCFLLVFVFYFEFSSLYVPHLVFTMSLFYSAVAFGKFGLKPFMALCSLCDCLPDYG